MVFNKLVTILLLLQPTYHVAGEVLQIHGSGTTNPSKCYWLIMSQIMDRSKTPVRLTYRAVGSGTGQKEFLGVNNTGTFEYVPYNDFGSGDIPVSTSDYDGLTNVGGKTMMHLPILLGAISVFHSVPGVDDLNMTGCLLSKVFKRDITSWDDDEILAINPNLDSELSEKLEINVARRVKGSSSTASITQYLRAECPSEWPASMVGKVIEWQPDTLQCEGSGGMTDCIRNNPGTIGYIDAGHGHEEGLPEIELKNKDGTYLSSKEAAANGGIGAAALSIPSDATANFGNVDLINKPGAYTWPIVAMSYLYVREDLSHIASDQEKTLLEYFILSLYDPDVISQCEEKFGFVAVPENVKSMAMVGINRLQTGSGTQWITETSTMSGVGQGEYVISGKRRSYAEYTYNGNAAALSTMETPQTEESSPMKGFYYSEGAQNDRIQSALVMSSISIVLWGVTILYFLSQKLSCK